jgi:hypothetical protein
MNNTKLMSEHYKEDGSVAKIYQVVTGMDGEHSFFSITELCKRIFLIKH